MRSHENCIHDTAVLSSYAKSASNTVVLEVCVAHAFIVMELAVGGTLSYVKLICLEAEAFAFHAASVNVPIPIWTVTGQTEMDDSVNL